MTLSWSRFRNIKIKNSPIKETPRAYLKNLKFKSLLVMSSINTIFFKTLFIDIVSSTQVRKVFILGLKNIKCFFVGLRIKLIRLCSVNLYAFNFLVLEPHLNFFYPFLNNEMILKRIKCVNHK
jgi:hypothetical protein